MSQRSYSFKAGTNYHWFFSFIWVLLSWPVLGQGNPSNSFQLPKVVPPSPNAAALGKYGDIPVSTYTGTADVSIPLYEIKAGDISVPISLSYHTSGIKVAEEASRVGLGWVLNAGGLISRNIMGMDDYEEGTPYSYFNTSELPAETSPADYIIAQPTIQPSCQEKGRIISFTGDQWFNSTASPYDFEPDLYSYNFLGYSGKFVLSRSKKVILSRLEKIKIIPPANYSGNWQVKTVDGTLYTFNEFEFYRDTQNNNQRKTAWYLTSIRSAKGEEVTFTYTTLPTDYIRPIGAWHERKYDVNLSMPAPLSGILPGSMPAPQQSVEPGKEYSNICLSSIDYKGGRVNFTYDSRQDLAGDKRLTAVEILVKQQGGVLAPLKKIELEHNYFNGDIDVDYYPSEGMSDYVTKRLKLVSVSEKAFVNNQWKSLSPYRFEYNEGVLPAKTSFARDHWGFYNGKTSNSSLVPEYKSLVNLVPTSNELERIRAFIGVMKESRDGDELAVKAFSLKSIHYPTGGNTLFDYEQHDFDPQLSKARDQSFFRDTPLTNKTVDLTLTYPGTNKGTVYTQTLNISDEYVDNYGNYQPIEVTTVFRFGGVCGTYNTVHAYVEIEGVNGTWYLNSATCTNANSSYAVYEHKYTVSLPPGVYTWKAFVNNPLNDSKAADLSDIRSTFRYVIKTEDAYKGGGLRIKQITDFDGIKAEGKIKRFVYNYLDDKNGDGTPENYSYGLLMARPQYTYFEHRYGRVLEPSTNEMRAYEQVLLVRSSDSNIILNGSASGNVVGYSQVSVLLGANGEFGKTVYQYENQPDQILRYTRGINLTPATNGSDATILQLPVRTPAVSTVASLTNGLLSSQIDYVKRGNDFVAQREITNEYVEARVSSEAKESGFYYGIENRWPITENIYECSSDLLIYPIIETKWIYRSSTTEKIYDQFDPAKFSSTTTNYYYEQNPVHYQVKTVTSFKQTQPGKVESMLTRYTYPADYSDAQCDGVVQAMKSDEYYLHSAVIEKTEWREKDGVQKILARSFTKNMFVATSTPGLTMILPQKVVALETDIPLSESGQPVSSDQVAPYIPSQSYDPAKYKERLEFSYTPQGNIRSVRRMEDNVWITYLWGYNNQYPIAEIKNATFLQVQNALGQATIDQLATSMTLDVAQLNPLRTIPNAMVSVYTYKPLVGIQTATGPDGTTLTYIYDAFQRLKAIKDSYGNIIKQYRYHYKGQVD